MSSVFFVEFFRPFLMTIMLVVFLFGTFMFLVRRYKRCPSDKVLVIFGKVGQDRASKCIVGGAAFVWPLIQQYGWLERTPMTIPISLDDALTKENIRINTSSTFTIAVATNPHYVQNAAIYLLNRPIRDIEKMAEDVIIGQFRALIATMELDNINKDRASFQSMVLEAVEVELQKLGLMVLNANIRDIKDSAGYLDALGKKATAEAKFRAEIEVAEQERRGAVGVANANRDKEIEVANAELTKRIEVANAEAAAITGERLAEQRRVQAESELRIKRAEFDRNAEVAEKTAQADTLQKQYEAEQKTELARLERDKARQMASLIPDAEALRAQEIIQAEAEKRKSELAGEGEAARIRAEAQGRADAIRLLLTAQAEGIEKVLKAANGDATAALSMLTVDKITELAQLRADALGQLAPEKVVVYDSGNGKSVGNYLGGLVGAVPAIHEMFEMAGIKPPAILGEKGSADHAS